ncbi:OmpA family protein [Bacteroides rodentium]|jgi:OOP family OmpA-OmpF porin
MKAKFLTLSILLAGSCVFANAQEKKNYYTKKASDNIFVGVGVGGMSVLNGGLNTPTMNFNLQVGKYITPTWGVRGEVSGLWQSLDNQDNSYFVTSTNEYHKYCKKFGEINLDAMLNLTTLFGGYNPNRVVDFYLFGGPTMNLSSKGTEFTGATTGDNYQVLQDNDDLKARFGATAGLGLGFNLNQKLALNVEGRLGVTPSIFGDASDCRKAEATARVNVGLTYTFGGKKFVKASNIDEDAVNAEINRYRSELAQAQADLANCKNSLANMKPEVKEVTKEIQVAGPRAIFFKIGSARLDDYGKVNIQLAAKILKANPDKKYKVAGYCDKATGSASWNQKLSEKRAQVVYDALVAEGVSKDQLELVGFGGTENMFGKNFLNRVVILE